MTSLWRQVRERALDVYTEVSVMMCCSGRSIGRSRDVIVHVITIIVSCYSNDVTGRCSYDAQVTLNL